MMHFLQCQILKLKHNSLNHRKPVLWSRLCSSFEGTCLNDGRLEKSVLTSYSQNFLLENSDILSSKSFSCPFPAHCKKDLAGGYTREFMEYLQTGPFIAMRKNL